MNQSIENLGTMLMQIPKGVLGTDDHIYQITGMAVRAGELEGDRPCFCADELGCVMDGKMVDVMPALTWVDETLVLPVAEVCRAAE